MRHARTIKFRAGGRPRTMAGGALSNIKKLEEDFAKQVTMGKAEPAIGQFSKASSDTIKKKFSI